MTINMDEQAKQAAVCLRITIHGTGHEGSRVPVQGSFTFHIVRHTRQERNGPAHSNAAHGG